jgi:hypothetical protein
MRIRRILISIPLIVFWFIAIAGAATTGGVSGKVTLEGAPPRPKPINMSAEPGCAKMYPTPASTEDVVVGPGGALENVVVYISAGAPPESTPPVASVSITQKGCRFAPHVVAMQVNQQFNVINSDSTSHNIHPLPTANREWNKAQPPGTPPLSEMFARAEFIPVKCNIHPWMHSYFVVLKTSHYAVTAESGAFVLNNLPPGKYTITAWHETYGTQTQEITLSADENAPVNFVFKAKP